MKLLLLLLVVLISILPGEGRDYSIGDSCAFLGRLYDVGDGKKCYCRVELTYLWKDIKKISETDCVIEYR